MSKIQKILARPGGFLFGRRQVGLSAAEIRKNVRYGTAPDRDEKWPLGYVDSNPTAAALAESTARQTSEEA